LPRCTRWCWIVTGLLFASALAAVGLYVLPNRRRKARDELRAKVADLQAAAARGAERAVRARR
jgi:hypothetical protein